MVLDLPAGDTTVNQHSLVQDTPQHVIGYTDEVIFARQHKVVPNLPAEDTAVEQHSLVQNTPKALFGYTDEVISARQHRVVLKLPAEPCSMFPAHLRKCKNRIAGDVPKCWGAKKSAHVPKDSVVTKGPGKALGCICVHAEQSKMVAPVEGG